MNSSKPLQRTDATASGTGLFTAAPAQVHIRPASAGAGVCFIRTDLPGSPRIPARVAHVLPESRRTTLSLDPAKPRAPESVQTVEHLLSALAGLGIADAIVEVDGPEIPMGDGSAALWVNALIGTGANAGAARAASHSPIVIREHITLADPAGGVIESFPLDPSDSPTLHVEYRLDYGPDSPIPAQTFAFAIGDPAAYTREVAPARTFSLQHEAEAMRAMGLFKHVGPRDMLVIGSAGPIDNEYRFADEPARHKVLDMIGDLSLAGLGGGRPILGRIIGTRSGHSLNHAMARALAAL